MLGFLYENLSTIAIGLVVLLLIFLAMRSIWRDKKQGKSCGSCPGGCSGGGGDSCDAPETGAQFSRYNGAYGGKRPAGGL